MSSLYNLMNGVNIDYEKILRALDLTEKDFGRFRDCSIQDNEICVFTRCGGGNREWYKWVFDLLDDHPNYLRNEDDDFDSTYCSFYFSIPESLKVDDINQGIKTEDRLAYIPE